MFRRRKEPGPVRELQPHRDVLDAATLGARYCRSCDRWEVSVHGTAWICTVCGQMTGNPNQGYGHIDLLLLLNRLVKRRPHDVDNGGSSP